MKEIYNIKKFRVGQIIEGKVLEVTDNEVLVDFGYFTEGQIYLNELTLNDVSSAKELYKKGDSIRAEIKKISDEQILLSRINLEKEENLRKLNNKFEHKNTIKGKVVKELKSAFIVKIYGIECLLPKNEIDVNENFDGKELLNHDVKVRVIEIDTKKSRVVVSRKVVIAFELFKEKLNAYKSIELEKSYEATVARVENYGVLVVVNNFQGLVPLREISHLPFNNVNEVIKVGDKVNVKVIEKNDEKLQVLFSIKALLLKPWEVIGAKIKEGDVIEGTIARITDFGAFVNIYPLVDGLLHKNEYSYNPNVNMFNEIKEGQKVTVKVLKIDANKERLSLSVKALKNNPWQTCDLKVSDIKEMTVVNFVNNDAIVKYVDDVEGVLPRSHVAHDKKIIRIEDELSIGQTVSVKVTEFDANERKLVVSIRRIKQDQERSEYEKFMKSQNNVKNDTLGDIFGNKLKDILK